MAPGPPVRRGEGRRFQPGNAASAAGGKAKAGKVSFVASLGLAPATLDGVAFAPYRRKAASFRAQHCRELAILAGGTAGSGPSSMVATAALQFAWSRYLFDLAASSEEQGSKGHLDLVKTASKLGDSSRQNLLAAYELAVREGKSREQGGRAIDPVEAEEQIQREHDKRARAALSVTVEAAE